MKLIHTLKLAPALLVCALTLASQQGVFAGGEGFSASAYDSKQTFDTKSSDVGLGKFSANPFHVTVSVRGGYDDNVNLSTVNAHDSFFTNAAIGLTYDFGSPRTRISLTTGASGTYYWDNGNNGFGTNSDDFVFNAYLGFNITHRATPRLTLAAAVNAAYLTRPGFDTFNNNAFTVDSRSQNYFQLSSKHSVAYAWTPRFSTVTSYTLGYVNYDDDVISFFEDRFEHTFGNEFRFLIMPTTTIVAEYRYGIVNYVDDNNRDSTSHFFLAGVDHSFSPRFNVSARGGVEVREFSDPGVRFGNVDTSRTAPYAEATLNYAIAQSTSLTAFARYSLEQPNVPDALSRETFRTSLALKHNFTARISTQLAVAYQHDQYDQTINNAAFDEDAFDISLSARYAITRNWTFDLGYTHSEVISPAALFRDYSRNQYYAGVTFLW